MNRSFAKFFFDLLLWTIAAPVAFWLRVDDPLTRYPYALWSYTALGVPVKGLLIYFFKLHKQSWRKVGAHDVLVLIEALSLGFFVLSAMGFFLYPIWGFLPRSIPLLEAGVALFFMGGARLAGRLLDEHRLAAGFSYPKRGKRVLIVGAGEAGIMLAREILKHPTSGFMPVGYLDDDPEKQGQRFLGLSVLGTINELPSVVKRTGAEEVLIAVPSAPGRLIRKVVDLSRKTGVKYKVIPSIHEILSGKVSISQLRDVDVVDLLRREPIKLSLEKIAKYLNDKVVLITGAGGSIGSEIVRQVARFHPKLLVLLGHGENSLYWIERELDRDWPDISWVTVVADVRDREKMEYVFSKFRPHVVFHAAAHKHVPMMEANPDEAIFNNILGTKNVVELASIHKVDRFVNISTDKAVNPTSIMGASKRVAEYLVHRAASKAGSKQVFVSVRFGNVLGSRGDVVSLFKEQIKRGGPVTVTHPDMMRYFMTIPEAAQLVLQAAGLDHNGVVYVLDMGEPVKIVDLAKDLIRLSGLTPGEDIDIVFTGIRPGEKLFEEILTAEEGTVATKYEKIYVAKDDASIHMGDKVFDELLKQLFEAAAKRDPDAIKRVLKKLVPTYNPNTGV
ncbi:MAG: polysaccharide biosynthesis protein [Gammaproteobacteria bacterium]|nr:polysaccharide biosynthesis protein [Gammaproteobacteria bacterium]